MTSIAEPRQWRLRYTYGRYRRTLRRHPRPCRSPVGPDYRTCRHHRGATRLRRVKSSGSGYHVIGGGGVGARGVALAMAMVCAALTSCAYLPPTRIPAGPTAEPRLVALDGQSCRALLRDDAPVGSLQQATARSIEALKRLPQDRVLRALDREVKIEDLVAVLSAVAEINAEGG